LKGGGVAHPQGTFRADRIIPIAERFGVDPKAVLDNIVVARVFTHEHQMQLLINVCALMVEQVASLTCRADPCSPTPESGPWR
jgi:DNA repair protein RAD51